MSTRSFPGFSRRLFRIARAFSLSAMMAMPQMLPAQEPSSGSSPLEPIAEQPLADDQAAVAEKFKRLEELLLRSSELEAVENPARAALLQQAAKLGKQRQLAELLAKAAGSLQNDQFSEALEQQKASRDSLQQLLELLQSENREERVREQRNEIRRWIEETDRLLRLQGSLRGRTEGGQDTQQAAKDQQRLSNKASEIADDLGGEDATAAEDRENGGQSNKDSNDNAQSSPEKNAAPDNPPDGQSPEGQSPDAPENDTSPKPLPDNAPQSADGSSDQPSDSQSNADADNANSEQPGSQGKSADQQDDPQSPSQSPQPGSESNQSQPGQSQPGQSQPGQSQPGQSQPGQSQPGQQSDSPQERQASENPMERARQRIQEAQRKMQEAQQALENAEREGAVERQREAEDNLREAIEELEQILRQLREEEIERSLASLEDRLRRMLAMQNKVLEETQRLLEIAGEGGANRQVEIRASNLSLEENKILAEGERAYLLLKEEGSSAAFPEAVEQMNADIGKVASRLNAGSVDKLTVAIEMEIVTSLEEMIEALVQVQKENQEKQRQQQQQGQAPQMQQGDQPLVDQLAELRLILTLQTRINKRTNDMSAMLDDPSDVVGQAQNEDIVSELRELSSRQSRIYDVTRNLRDSSNAR